jgi:hypothetical protein
MKWAKKRVRRIRIRQKSKRRIRKKRNRKNSSPNCPPINLPKVGLVSGRN